MSKSSVPNMKPRRIQLNKTQKQLAAIVRTTQTVISDYESGKSSPRADVLVEIASALETSTDYLVGLTDNPRRADAPPLSVEAQRMIDMVEPLSQTRREWIVLFLVSLLESTKYYPDDQLPR